MMDLNSLLKAHQILEKSARIAGSASNAQANADQIRALRKLEPGSPLPADPHASPTIIYGSYARYDISEEIEGDGLLPGENPE